MGLGKEVKIRAESPVEIQERGETFFFYRPKVNKEEAHSAEDVQCLYIVLSVEKKIDLFFNGCYRQPPFLTLRPESGEKTVEEKQDPHSGKEDAIEKGSGSETSPIQGGHGSQQVNIETQPLLRFIIMGRKSLPDPSQKSRPYWGYVDLVTTHIEDVKTALKGEEYDTATRGHRHNVAARALAEGVYRILRHKPGKRMHTHLIYKLELPPENEKNEPQESLNIEPEASFLIQIKNPNQHGNNSRFRGLQNKRKAVFPAHLQGQFGQLKYGPADPPDFLNYEGCEFLLISASDDIEDELGLELKLEVEGETNESCSDLVKTFGETGSAKPLLEGTWA